MFRFVQNLPKSSPESTL